MTEAYFDSSYSRRNALRLMVAGAAGLAAPGLLGTPAFAQKAPAKPSGRIVVGLGQEPTVFNPLMAHIEVDDGVHFSVFDALFRIDQRVRLSPTLPSKYRTRRTAAFRRTASNGASVCVTVCAGTTANPSRPRM